MNLGRATHFSGLAAGSSIHRKVVVSASKTSGQILAVQNPFPKAVIATVTTLLVDTGSSAACTLDIGTAANGTTSSDNLIDGISVNAAANTVYNSINDGGTDGKTRQYVPAGYFFTATVASGNANGLAANFFFNFMPISGGEVGGDQLFS